MKLSRRSLLAAVLSAPVVAKARLMKPVPYFIRYKRMSVPLTAVAMLERRAETFNLEQTTVTIDQWGDILVVDCDD